MKVGSAVLPVFLAWSFCGCHSLSLHQPTLSITRPTGKIARFRCLIDTGDFINLVVHWYRSIESGGFRRILYIQANKAAVRDAGSSDRFTAENLIKGNFSLLDVRDIEESDAGDYYCATWDNSGSWKKIFGQGTQLIVTNKKPSAPTVRLFPPKLQNDKGFVACLVTDFFPNVINVKWKIDDKTLSSNLLEISVNQMEGGTYSTIDHLEVTKVEWEEKTIVCYVEHEAGNEKASTSRKKREEAHTSEVPENPKCPPKDKDLPEIMVEGTSSSSLRVAIFTYTLLLMKSVLYCGIISFIVYKVEYRDTKKPL